MQSGPGGDRRLDPHDFDLFADAESTALYDEVDSNAEVRAAFHSQRRIALGHFVVFAVAIAGTAAATLALGWWTRGRVLGGMTPGFLGAGLALYAVFLVIVIAGARLSNAVEDQMMGRGTSGDGDGSERRT
ncbi:MAG: hypothetical protein R2705_20680 [Ilumatobacteraceae bacterium]